MTEGLSLRQRGFQSHFAEMAEERDGNRRVFFMRVGDRHLDGSGRMSAGAMLAFADHAVGHACITVLGLAQVTLQLQMGFLGPVALGETLRGEGFVQAHVGDIVHVRGEFHVADRLVATADGRWKAVKPLA